MEKLCKTQTVPDLHLNRQSCHDIQYSKLNHNKQVKRFEKYQKKGNGRQEGSCAGEKNISIVWNVGQFDI